MLKAHYDGERICLDEPFRLEPDTRLRVRMVSVESAEEEKEAWRAASQSWLARAYGDDEPDYSEPVICEQPSRE